MTNDGPVVFVLDANVFMEAHRRYYALDLCPGFWECLAHYCREPRLLSIDRVRDPARLDLGLFINGLPVFAFEFNNSLSKRTVEDGVAQYKVDTLRLHNLLQKKPIISIPAACKALDLTHPPVNKSLRRMEEMGIVREMTGRQRSRLYVYDAYRNTLTEGMEAPAEARQAEASDPTQEKTHESP